MKIDFLLFGVPYGFQTIEATDEEWRFSNQFYNNDSGQKTYIHKRHNNKVYYTHTIHADKNSKFCDAKGREGSFVGIMLGFDGQYCRDYRKIDNIFQNIYKDLINEGYIKENNGSHQWAINDLKSHEKGIEEVCVKAIKSSGLKQEDFEAFQFHELKGRYQIHPSDMLSLNEYLMKSAYNIEISNQYPTQEMLCAQKANTK